MPSLLDLPLYVVHSIAGASSAALAKASLHRLLAREYLAAVMRFCGACLCLGASLSLLMVLLRRTEMSVMVPVAVGLNLLIASVISILIFRESVNARKAGGMFLIACGVALLSVAW
jgi:multidrug transporter EmrE-like cation transporter